MRWTALVENTDHVCCRYRLRAFESHLTQAGFSLSFVSLPRSFTARQQLFESLNGKNLLLQRRLLDAWSWRSLRRHAARIAFDFDDAVWLRDSYSPRGLVSWQRARRFRRTMRGADLIFAGNSFLASAASRHADSHKVLEVPTCVKPQQYSSAAHSQRDTIQLVWIGSSSTLRGLEKITGLLDTIGSKLPNVRLKLICDRTIQLKRMPVNFHPWSEETEAAALANADIGISWLPDDDWSRGKCGLKLLQYMAAGLPVVANPVGVQRELVVSGKNGFLARSTDESVEAIALLGSSPTLRHRLGQNGRRLVDERYSVSAIAPRLIEALSCTEARVRAVSA